MFYRFVGDIHGQVDMVEDALDSNADRIIFVGDIMDSWRRSPEDQIRALRLLLDHIGDRVSVVFGNHDLSYLYRSQRCSGYKDETQLMFNHHRDEVLEKFKPFVYEHNLLVTHAGLTLRLWEDHQLTLDNFQEKLAEWFRNPQQDSPYYQVGYARSGRKPYGGPVWCDLSEFEDIPGLPQVFGHSRGKSFRQIGDSICIDVLENNHDPIFLDMELTVEIE